MEGALVKQITYASTGISNARDQDRLETAIGGIEGVRDVKVDADEHTIQITYDPTVVDATRLQAATVQAGYAMDRANGRDDAGDAAAFLTSDVAADEWGSRSNSPASGGPDLAVGGGVAGAGLGTGLGTGIGGAGPGNDGYGPVIVPASEDEDRR